jgi:hypothetical protein
MSYPRLHSLGPRDWRRVSVVRFNAIADATACLWDGLRVRMGNGLERRMFISRDGLGTIGFVIVDPRPDPEKVRGYYIHRDVLRQWNSLGMFSAEAGAP